MMGWILMLTLPAWWSSSISGFVRSDAFWLSSPGLQGPGQVVRIRLRWEPAWGPFTFKFHPELDAWTGTSVPLRPLIAGQFLDDAAPWHIHREPDTETYAILDRWSVTFAHGPVQLTVGRDRYPWGKVRFFSLLDQWNPYEPLAFGMVERQGVRGARLQLYRDDFSWMELLYVHTHAADAYGVAVFATAGAVDFQVAAATGPRRWVGGAFSGGFGRWVLRGEMLLDVSGDLEWVTDLDVQASDRIYVTMETGRSRGHVYPVGTWWLVAVQWQMSDRVQLFGSLGRFADFGTLLSLTVQSTLTPDLDVQFTLFLTNGTAPNTRIRLGLAGWQWYF